MINMKNMINIPGIYRHLKYGPAKKFQKKELPSGAKNLVWEAFLENQDFTQKSPTPSVIY